MVKVNLLVTVNVCCTKLFKFLNVHVEFYADYETQRMFTDTPNPINLEDISSSKFYLRSTLLLQYRFETSLIQGIAALLLHLPSDTDFKVGDYLNTNILDHMPVYSIYLYLFLSDILSVRRCMFLFKLS